MTPTIEPAGWEMLSLNDLPRRSPWPARLLGSSPWVTQKRTTEKVETEYNRDKYLKCLEEFERVAQTGATVTFEAIKGYEAGWASREPIAVSVGDDLYLALPAAAFDRYYQAMVEYLVPAIRGCRSVVELGCGYGFNLHRLCAALSEPVLLAGGEFSANAVALGNRLATGDGRCRLREFDYYDPAAYDYLFADVPDPIAVFTAHSVEQIPTAAPLFDNLRRFKDRVRNVVHLEPAYGQYGCTLLGLLRRRYTEANDYNRDLLDQLRGRPDVRFDVLAADLFGLNPLNPTSVIRWAYADR